MPESWDQQMVEFHRNDSSWCADNGLREIDKAATQDGQCACRLISYVYLREATGVDHEVLNNPKETP